MTYAEFVSLLVKLETNAMLLAYEEHSSPDAAKRYKAAIEEAKLALVNFAASRQLK